MLVAQKSNYLTAKLTNGKPYNKVGHDQTNKTKEKTMKKTRLESQECTELEMHIINHYAHYDQNDFVHKISENEMEIVSKHSKILFKKLENDVCNMPFINNDAGYIFRKDKKELKKLLHEAKYQRIEEDPQDVGDSHYCHTHVSKDSKNWFWVWSTVNEM